MQINNQVHLIRKEFNVTPEVKRYINIYLIVGRYCYLVDTGVTGSENLIEEYLKSINRTMSDIKGVLLTHSHPDHAGAAAAIKRMTNCRIYAPQRELPWIEDIQQQFKERPIPNFFKLLAESVKVDQSFVGGEMIEPEEGIGIHAISTPGHSHGSMSYILNDEVIFTGDAIPVANDLPIFVDYKQSIESMDRIHSLPEIQYFCPAWDEIYNKEELDVVLENSKAMLSKLKNVVLQVEDELPKIAENEKLTAIFERADMLKFAGNPLVVKSIEACRKNGS